MKRNDNIELWVGNVIQGAITIIVGSIFTFLCILGFIRAVDSTTRIVIIPFFICGMTILIRGIVSLIKGLNWKKGIKDNSVSAEEVFNAQEKLDGADNALSKIYMWRFLLFWFGFLLVFDYFAIVQKEMLLLVISLIFWAIGIYSVIKSLK